MSILKDFGAALFGGMYAPYASRFGAQLLRLIEEPERSPPKASLLRDCHSTMVGVAARDYRGLAATISGALWRQGIELRQAHLFSARQHSLALDFFHFALRDRPLPTDLMRHVEDAIRGRLYIAESDEASLPRVKGIASLREWRPGQHYLRFESAENDSGLIYALTYKVFRHFQGNIFGLTAHATRGQAFVSVYHDMPPGLPLEQAQAIVAQRF